MVHTIAAGYSSLKEQADKPGMYKDERSNEAAKEFKDQQLGAKEFQLEVLRDLLERVNGQIDEVLKEQGATVVELKPEEQEQAKERVEEVKRRKQEKEQRMAD